MLRELAEALEVLTAEKPLVLVLEDLHWSDTSTVILLSYLSYRRQSARLLILGTYRPVDVIIHNHPLKGAKQELQRHGQCHELPLSGLTEGEVVDYLTSRFGATLFPRTLVKLIHQRTGGTCG
jgi:predicted ATPase